ncbi:concanavalin A-like lectin/glucanase superfamily protein [Rathayibacter sp. PhB127]|uniref:LamG-like jellyroll fold domain-containing protein n=1 Tax=Rathayibacter sp. PhB127 TaxID=2485176 RepID=UPI000F4CB14D|nr:LamG-like jellyroll fold domain-containing protein [Rathayibacter sp. PhB127]ROS23326.1 concanavalin A-like lectin/glucanase superfamily protein [Rathayibacter sp. PhB127]
MPTPTRRAPFRAALAALGLGAVLAAGLVAPTATAADAAAPTAGLLADYRFSQTTGATVPNSAGGAVGAARVVNGTDALWTGTSLRLTGGAKTSAAPWVELPDDLLTGKSSGTVTIETRADASMLSNFHFLWNIGSDSTSQYWFASVRDKVRTAITTTGGGGENNARSASGIAADRWYSLSSVIDGAAGTISFYVDGTRVASAPTALRPASVADQSLNAIGRAPYPDPFYKGEVSTFRVYDRALTGEEVATVSSVDAKLHASSFAPLTAAVLDGVTPLTIDDSTTNLPDYGGTVTWASSDPTLRVSADGRTLAADRPAAGQAARTSSVTATASIRGVAQSRAVAVTVEPQVGVDTPYGYLMVHFVEDAQGYAEKIYLDVSRGDDPEKWDPLNGGKPILASDLGTTGVRDPYLTYNPETKKYYIIATDLRVFGGDQGSGSCTTWCYWTTQGSTKMNVWESTDLVSWSDLRQFDVALDAAGTKQLEAGMMWAPEATWVADYNGAGKGAFVVYWSSTVYPNAAHTPGTGASRVLWGATTDFTQATYSYGGTFIDTGADVIDTTMIQDGGTTYRISKDNGTGRGIYMESTTAKQWWLPSTAWTQLQDRIGAVWAGGNAGGVEGPAVFKDHDTDRWYLYVDVIPATGYRPMVTTDLDAGWTQLTDPGFSLASSTKHGGIVSLTAGQYAEVRAADAATAVRSDLGEVGSVAALPARADVVLAYNRGTASQPVAWDTSSVGTAPGRYPVTGVVRTIGANDDQWVGAGGSTAYNAPNRVLSSSTAVRVTATVVVAASTATLTASTRCVAGKVVVTGVVKNTGTSPLTVVIRSAWGTSPTLTAAPGASATHAFTTRATSVAAGTLTATAGGATLQAPYAARACG